MNDAFHGIVSFENSKTGTKISVRPADLESGIYGIKSITMDSGAGYTILPEGFATLLDISRPEDFRASYYIFSGVGGTSVCFLSPDPLYLGIEDMPGNKVVKEITPFFLTSYAPSITSEGQLLAQEEHQPQTSQVIDFISPPFKHCDEYMFVPCARQRFY